MPRNYFLALIFVIAVACSFSRIWNVYSGGPLWSPTPYVPKYIPTGDLLPAKSAAISPGNERPDAEENPGNATENPYAHLRESKPSGAIARLGSARMVVGGQWTAAMAFSPDNRWLAAGGEEDTCTLWEVASGNLARALAGHGEITSVAFSPDGKSLAVCGQESVRVWDPATGKSVGEVARGAMPQAAAFSHDGKQIAVADYHAVTLWDAVTRKLLLRSSGDSRPAPMEETDHFQSIAFSPDGKWLAAASMNDRLTPPAKEKDLSAGIIGGVDTESVVQFHLWDLSTGKHVRNWEAFSAMTVLFSHDSKSVIGIAGKQELAAWDVATGNAVRRVEIGKEAWNAVLLPDGKTLAVGAGDGIEMWDWETQKLVERLPVQAQQRALACSPDGTLLGSSVQEMLSVTVRATGRPAASLDRHDGWIAAVAFAPDGKTVTCATPPGLRVWNVAEAKPITDTPAGTARTTLLMAYSPDGLAIATTASIASTGAPTAEIEMWSAVDAKSKWRRKLDGVERSRAVFLDHGKTLAVTGVNGELHLLDPADGKTIKTITPQNESIDGLVVSPDGKRLATSGKSGVVRVIDTGTWAVTRELTSPYPATPQMFSSNGRLLAAKSNSTAIVWDADTGSVIRHLTFTPNREHDTGDSIIVFNDADVPFALRNSVSDESGGVEFWNLASGKKTAFVRGIMAGNANDVSRDRRMLALGSFLDVVIYPMPQAAVAGGAMTPTSEPLPDIDVFAAIRLGRVKRVEEFLKKNPKLVEAIDQNGMTTLAWAVSCKDKAMVSLLLASGANVNRTFLHGSTALHSARDVETARLLLDQGAKVDAGSGPIGTTPLEVVYLSGDIELTRLLLDRGADANRQSIGGISMLDMAVISKRQDVADLLKKYGAKSNRGN